MSIPNPFPEKPIAGTPTEENPTFSKQRWWKVLLGILVCSTIGVWLLGQIQQGKFNLTWQRVFYHAPELVFIDAREGVVLFEKSEKDRSEVLVQMRSQNGWQILSGADYTACRSSLSLSGTRVAYFSRLEEPHIAVVSLITDTHLTLTATVFDTTVSSRQLSGMVICDWSPVAWSSDENHLAFFVCTPDSSISYVVAAALDDPSPRIVWVENTPFGKGERSVIWLDVKTLLVGNPSPSGTKIVAMSLAR